MCHSVDKEIEKIKTNGEVAYAFIPVVQGFSPWLPRLRLVIIPSCRKYNIIRTEKANSNEIFKESAVIWCVNVKVSQYFWLSRYTICLSITWKCVRVWLLSYTYVKCICYFGVCTSEEILLVYLEYVGISQHFSVKAQSKKFDFELFKYLHYSWLGNNICSAH